MDFLLCVLYIWKLKLRLHRRQLCPTEIYPGLSLLGLNPCGDLTIYCSTSCDSGGEKHTKCHFILHFFELWRAFPLFVRFIPLFRSLMLTPMALCHLNSPSVVMCNVTQSTKHARWISVSSSGMCRIAVGTRPDSTRRSPSLRHSTASSTKTLTLSRSMCMLQGVAH